MNNFQPLEVVDRDSETQPQVVGHLNKGQHGDNLTPHSGSTLL